jgi:hypothetical protein
MRLENGPTIQIQSHENITEYEGLVSLEDSLRTICGTILLTLSEPEQREAVHKLSSSLDSKELFRVTASFVQYGEGYTFLFDVDGVFNKNTIRNIFACTLDNDAVEIMTSFCEIFHEANFIALSSRPASWPLQFPSFLQRYVGIPQQDWKKNILKAIGSNTCLATSPGHEKDIQDLLQPGGKVRALLTDTGKNVLERLILPFLGRENGFHGIKTDNFPFILDTIARFLHGSLHFIDSGDYSKDYFENLAKKFPHIHLQYFSILEQVLWDEVVLFTDKVWRWLFVRERIQSTLLSFTGFLISSSKQ